MLGTRVDRGFLLRKIGGQFGAITRFGLATGNGIMRRGVRDEEGDFEFKMFTILALIVLAVWLVFAPHHFTMANGMALTGMAGYTSTKKSGTDDKKPANIRKMEADLKAIATELEQGQIEMAAGPITPERGEELEEKAAEMESLQEHIDRYNKIAGITANARKMDKVTLPDDADRRVKSITTTPGHLFIASEAFKHYKNQGKQGWSAKVDLGRRFGKNVTLRGEEAIEFEKKAFDPAQLAALGDNAIVQIDRDPEIVRFQDPELLTIRDVLTVVPTTSDAIRFVRHTQLTRAAATQNPRRGGLKNYLELAFEGDTVSVETIAVLSKVSEQDVDDAPRLVGYINGEMTLDVRVEEERQLTWGDGTNGQLQGLFSDAVNMPEFDRSAVGDTVIDTIRKMRTDLRKNRVTPNFVLIDPIDWEQVELTKGTTAQYIWGLVTDMRGPRIWSLRVVESDAMTNIETGERRLCVGDGIRGATIYDRNAIQLAVGFVDDDFARNLRTLRAEERIAMAVKRPFAFEYATTEAPNS